MQFTDLPSGDLNMKRYVELLFTWATRRVIASCTGQRPRRSLWKRRARIAISIRPAPTGSPTCATICCSRRLPGASRKEWAREEGFKFLSLKF